jgi:hypothetical protein
MLVCSQGFKKTKSDCLNEVKSEIELFFPPNSLLYAPTPTNDLLCVLIQKLPTYIFASRKLYLSVVVLRIKFLLKGENPKK